MLQFGSHHHHRDQREEEEWRQLLRETMLALDRRAFIADCKEGSRTPSQPPYDYFAFDPDDSASVLAHAPALCKCLADISIKAKRAKRALPPIEALPPAIRGCKQQLIVEYLEDWTAWRV